MYFKDKFQSKYSSKDLFRFLVRPVQARLRKQTASKTAFLAIGLLTVGLFTVVHAESDTLSNVLAKTSSQQGHAAAQAPSQQPPDPNQQSKSGNAPVLNTVPNNSLRSLTGSSSSPVSQKTSVSNRFGLTLPQEYVLPNGLKVLILEDHAFPVVSCLMWYHVGSRNEPPGTSGLSHLVEHLLFSNVGTFKKNQLAATIVANGGQFNGFTSEDFTVFYSTLPSNKYELSIRGEAERMRGAKFTKADVASELTNLIKEHDSESREPIALLNREVHATAFDQHPYRNPPGGWRSDLERLSYEDARWFYDRYYHPDNATLVLVGDLKAITALNTAKKLLAAIPKAPRPIPTVRVQDRLPVAEKRVLMKAAGKKDAVVLAYRAPSASDPDAAAMAVLEKLLNAPVSGRIQKQLIDSKMCSTAQAVFELKRDPSLFTINLTALAGSTPTKVLETTDVVLAQLRNQVVAEAELNRAKRQAEFEFFNESDGPYRTGFHLGMFDSLSSWQANYAWTEKIRRVSAADLQRVACRLLNNDTRVVGILNASGSSSPPSSSSPGPVSAPKAIAPNTTGWAPGRTGRGTERRLAQLRPDVASEITSDYDQLFAGNFSNRGASYKADDSALSPNSNRAIQGTASLPVASDDSEQSLEKVAATRSESPQANPANNYATLRTTRGGINVLLIESHLNPLVEIYGSVRAGAVFEPSDLKGSSALLTGLLNYGSSRYSRQQLIADQDDLGLTPSAMLNFNSGIEEITFRTRCQSADLSGQLARLASCLMQPRFNDSDVEKIRQDVLNSVPSTDDSVPAKVHRALMKSLAAESSKFVPPDPAEKAQALAALKTSDLREFYANCVNPKSTCLVIAGNINPSQALSLVDNAFSGWGSQQQKISAKLPSLLSDLGAQERRSIRTSIPISEKLSGMVCFGRVVPLPTQETEDKFWTRLLLADCALIKHPIFSHIGHRLELDPGLAALANGSGPTSRIEIFTDASVWTLLLRLEGNGSPNLVQTIQSELANFVKAGLTQEELIESKRYLLGYIPVSQMANLDSLSRTSLESLKNFGDPNPLDKAANQIRSVTLDSVNKFIAQTFKPDQAAIVIVANKQVIHSLQPQRIGSGL